MNYISQFVDALQFLMKLEKGARNSMGPLAGYREVFDLLQTPEMRERYAEVEECLKAMGEMYLKGFPGNPAHACHALAQGFNETWLQAPWAEGAPLAVTIGNVYYRGESIYNVSKSSIKRILNEGPQGQGKLNVHVWLTLDSMTVLDLSILSSLAAMGVMPPLQDGERPVLVWRDDQPSDFKFEPLLVHNNFFDRVDIGDLQPLHYF